MGILGAIESKKKLFCVGGREVLCIDADFPVGKSPAAKHFLNLVQALCAYAERKHLKGATDALMAAVGTGQAHHFARRLYRITLSEAPVGKRCSVTLTASFSFFDTRSGERIARLRQLETFWDAEGLLQADKTRKRRRGSAKIGREKPKDRRKGA